MSTIYALTQAQALANLRIDLNDPSGAGSRWQDTDLTRSLDRSLERISSVEPDLEETQLATQQAVRTYLKPTGALWIDRLEYPAGQWPPSYPAFSELRSPQLLAPLFLPILAGRLNGASQVTAGTHTWGFTYVTPGGGETTMSGTVGILVLAGTEVDITFPTTPMG
jgi:hypothetical protein